MNVFRACFLAFCVAAHPTVAALLAAQQPNIVLIMTDDQGYGDFGVAGNPVLETPHLDALARNGASLKHFYVSPVCSPTRASLLTGRYNYRTRVVDTFKGRSMMDPSEVTIAEVLRDAGYATGIFGKWHLGDNYPMRATDQGFQEALVIRGGGLAQWSDPIENERRYTDPIVFHNDHQVQAKGYCTDVYFDAALRFIDAARSEGRPFFAYIAPNAPHDPLHDVPTALYAKYKAKDLTAALGETTDADALARVYAMVENIDENVGRLMAWLKARGVLSDTVVIFLCDNGPATLRFAGSLRGRKTEPYEGGVRSPFFIHWPGHLKAGAQDDHIAAHIDVMPTLLEIAGVQMPAGLKLDGRSVLPLLEGRATNWPDRALVLQSHRGNTPVAFHNMAVVTQRWKLVRPSGFGREVPAADAPFELYDLLADPSERNNLIASEPAVARRLRDIYGDWFADVSASRLDNFAPPRIIVGSDLETTTVLTRQNWRPPLVNDNGRTGAWLLRAEREAAYTIELRWLKPVPAGAVDIVVGPVTRSVDLPAATDRVTVEKLRVPKSDLEFTATHRQTGEGPYQVTMAPHS